MTDTAFWTGRRVALTGATGFVGLHMARLLVAAGARVVECDTMPLNGQLVKGRCGDTLT